MSVLNNKLIGKVLLVSKTIYLKELCEFQSKMTHIGLQTKKLVTMVSLKQV